jgi:hypothetical protein
MRFRLLLVVHRHLDVATTAHMHTATLFRAAMLDMNFFADRLFALIDKNQSLLPDAFGLGGRKQFGDGRGDGNLQLLDFG